MSRFSSCATTAGGSSTSAASSARGAIDSLVQGSLVELFDAHHVALAPLPRSPAQLSAKLPEVSVTAAFSHTTGDAQQGRLTLSLPSVLLELMLVRNADSASVKLDWARELTNQLTGRIKNRLLPFGVRLRIGQLVTVDSRLLEGSLRALPSLRVYAGRTVRGDVLVTLQGMPEEHLLAYQGSPLPVEGSVLWF